MAANDLLACRLSYNAICCNSHKAVRGKATGNILHLPASILRSANPVKLCETCAELVNTMIGFADNIDILNCSEKPVVVQLALKQAEHVLQKARQRDHTHFC